MLVQSLRLHRAVMSETLLPVGMVHAVDASSSVCGSSSRARHLPLATGGVLMVNSMSSSSAVVNLQIPHHMCMPSVMAIHVRSG